MELMELKRTGCYQTEILGGECLECAALNGKIFTIEKALEKMPIPHEKCTHELKKGKIGWCRCEYLPVVDD